MAVLEAGRSAPAPAADSPAGVRCERSREQDWERMTEIGGGSTRPRARRRHHRHHDAQLLARGESRQARGGPAGRVLGSDASARGAVGVRGNGYTRSTWRSKPSTTAGELAVRCTSGCGGGHRSGVARSAPVQGDVHDGRDVYRPRGFCELERMWEMRLEWAPSLSRASRTATEGWRRTARHHYARAGASPRPTGAQKAARGVGALQERRAVLGFARPLAVRGLRAPAR